MDDWWEKNLLEHEHDGRKDADRGIFDLPHQFDQDDPQNADENEAYKKGYFERRRELEIH